jgi:3-keto-disaccharide hydrolase
MRFYTIAATTLLMAGGAVAQMIPTIPYPPSDRSRPAPLVVTPGRPSTQARAGTAPSDAIVLFDGKDLSAWTGPNGRPTKWTVHDGYFQVAPNTGDLITRQKFGDCQLHVEWASPNPPHGEDQDRGNSGVYVMSLYEIQVLDSYHSKTYPDGEAAAIYDQYPPLVNASLPPGKWQTYDIVFHGPRFDSSGKLLRPATATVFHNGILVQDHVTLTGPTANKERPPYKPQPERMPLLLQDHHNPVRYRNIWIREIPSGK